MELQDFIEQSLIQICKGIANARKQIGNAIASGTTSSEGNIAFEVACTVKVAAQKAGGGKIGFSLEVLSGSINKNSDKTNSTEAIQKISFAVPYSPYEAAQYLSQQSQK